MYPSRSAASAGKIAQAEILKNLLILQYTIFCKIISVCGGNIGLFCKCTLAAAQQALTQLRSQRFSKNLLVLQCSIFCGNMGVFGGNIGLFGEFALGAAREALAQNPKS